MKLSFEKFHKKDFDGALFVTDACVAELFGICGDDVFLLPRGEEAKSFQNLENLCKWYLQKNLERDGLVVAVGGGSVGDVAGLSASVYKRGVRLTMVPTTLLAMIDSGIGGKTAIDLCGVKNVVGSFVDCDTLIDLDFLATLSKEQIADGMGEMYKYRLLDANIDEICARGDLSEAVKACAEYKLGVVASDPFDRGARRKLNLGHTVAHALELRCRLSHGAAVARGLYFEAALSQKLGYVSVEFVQKVQKQLFPDGVDVALCAQDVDAMAQDKKNSQGKISFVLPCENHSATEVSLTKEQVAKVFDL